MTSTWSLTPETDSGPEFTGTAGDDTFLGYISQNPFSGGVSNTLSSADRLDGGAGYDTLFAEIVPEFFGVTGDNQIDIQPRTVSIEQVEFEARDLGQDFWSFFEDPSVTVDAKHMYGVERIGSKQSDSGGPEPSHLAQLCRPWAAGPRNDLEVSGSSAAVSAGTDLRTRRRALE